MWVWLQNYLLAKYATIVLKDDDDDEDADDDDDGDDDDDETFDPSEQIVKKMMVRMVKMTMTITS